MVFQWGELQGQALGLIFLNKETDKHNTKSYWEYENPRQKRGPLTEKSYSRDPNIICIL